MIEKVQQVKSPDLVMQINATEQQMVDFRIEIEGSKIIRRGKKGKIEGNIGAFFIPDAIFDFSPENKLLINQPLVSDSGKVHLGGLKLTHGAYGEVGYNLKSFPNTSHVSLKYFTPKTKSRTDVPGEYRAGDYFELIITNKDGSKKIFYLEQDFEIHSK